jgi:hypothetical protein
MTDYGSAEASDRKQPRKAALADNAESAPSHFLCLKNNWGSAAGKASPVRQVDIIWDGLQTRAYDDDDWPPTVKLPHFYS